MNPEAPASDGRVIARKAARAIFWNYASFGLGKVLVLVTIAILARLLAPADFGIVGFATVAVSYLSILKDLGLGAALIQRRQDLEEAADSVFTLNLLLGLVMSLVTIAIAPLAAAYFREPLVTPVLRLLGLTFFLNALGAVHLVRLQRELEFRRKLVPDLGQSFVKGAVSIGCALGGLGVWSLVIGQLAGVLTSVILAWRVFPWRPRLVVNGNLARTLLRYGMSVIGVDALAIITDNFDYLVVGRVLGSVALGVYTLAYRLPELLMLNILWVMAAAIFPAYAAVQNQPETLRRGFLATVRFAEMLSVPLALGLILAADPLVRVAFGEQWLAAIPVMRLLALFALVRSVGSNVGDIYKAVGRPDILVKLGLLNLVVLMPALWFGSRYGLVGVALGHVLAGLFRTVARLFVATRFVKVTWVEILRELKPSVLGGIALTALALPTLYLTAGMAPLARLLLVGLAGATGYLAVLWLLERESMLQAGRLVGLPGFGRELAPSTVAVRPAPPTDVG